MEKDRYGYERDLMRWLDRLLADLRKRMEANKRRLESISKPAFLAEDQAALDALSKEIDGLLERAAELGEQGEVDAALAVTNEADALKERRAQIERQADSRSGNNAMRGLVQSVCPVSGLIINDEDSRLRDHHAGRNYNSWKKLHEVHAALSEKLRERKNEASKSRRDDRDHRTGGSRYDWRGRDRRRSRRRSRSGSRSRSRSRSRERGYRGSKSRYRGRDYNGVGHRGRRDHFSRDKSPEEGEVR